MGAIIGLPFPYCPVIHKCQVKENSNRKRLKKTGNGCQFDTHLLGFFPEKFIKLVYYDFFLQFCELFVISLLQ